MNKIEFVTISLFLLLGLWLAPLFLTTTFAAYNSTALVNTTVNITNSAPIVKLVEIETPINLNGYANKTIYCNVTTYDYDNDTLIVNATFHYYTVGAGSAIDKNTLYQNTSCKRNSVQGFYMNWSCGVELNYFANNGTWYCNSTAKDIENATGLNISTGAKINPLVALRLTSIIDYGDLPANNISSAKIANVTNAGNRNINVTVNGFGAAQGDNLAMVCTSGSIGVGYERYDKLSATPYVSMAQLTSSDVKISNFWVNQRLSETNDSMNQTFWRIQIPPGAGGVCTGKILFTASDRLG